MRRCGVVFGRAYRDVEPGDRILVDGREVWVVSVQVDGRTFQAGWPMCPGLEEVAVRWDEDQWRARLGVTG